MKPALAFAVASAAAGAAGCSRQTLPVGGVMVMMSTDGSLQPQGPYVLRVDVRSPGGGGPYYVAAFDIPTQTRLPTSLAIASNGDPSAAFVIDVSLASPSAGTPIDVRSYEVDNVPTDRVVELDIVFSRTCSPHAEPDGGCPARLTCSPGWGGQCRSSVIEDGSQLPRLGVDAGPFGGIGPTATDAADAGALDGADATLEAETSNDAEAGESADAAIGCPTNARRCYGQTPQACDSTGQWQDDSACDTATAHCVDGQCLPKPPSCHATSASAPINSGVDFQCGRGGASGDCCGTLGVEGGMFFRTDDGGTPGDPASVAGFRLDAYEVTVGRFRNFVNAVVTQSWRPDAGAGTHTHVHGGLGLADAVDGGPPYESGWDPNWNAQVTSSEFDWSTNLQCDLEYSTWTPSSDTNEKLPINCVNWYEAYAFCIWDEGFLPSEAEWTFAAAGGGDRRLYPWGSASPSASQAIYGCSYMVSDAGFCMGLQNIAPVGLTTGMGKWGQWDLAGNMGEWTLDWYSSYETPCLDCAALTGGLRRVTRGGAFDSSLPALRTTARAMEYPTFRLRNVGLRCARSP
jgi:sulfatase modifying factor 1